MAFDDGALELCQMEATELISLSLYIYISLSLYLYISLSLYTYIYIYIGVSSPGGERCSTRASAGAHFARLSRRVMRFIRKTDSIHHHHHHLHHHAEGVVYRSFCLNSSALAVSETASRRWWCIESLFPFIRSLLSSFPRLLPDSE